MATIAGLHEVGHPLLTVGARRHRGRAQLVALVALGFNVLLPERCGGLGVHVGLANLVGPRQRSGKSLCAQQDHSLVETKDNSTKTILFHSAFKGIDPVLGAAPEHGPEVVAEGISLRGLVDAPSVETASTSAFVPAKSSRDGVRTQRHGRS